MPHAFKYKQKVDPFRQAQCDIVTPSPLGEGRVGA